MNIIKEISNLPKASVFGLYNRKKNKVFLCLGKDTTKRLCSLVTELKYNSHRISELCNDLDDLELIILETSTDPNLDNSYKRFKLHMNYWYDYIETSGITLYGTRYNYIEYKPRITYGLNYNGESVVMIDLVTRRNDSFTVGLFSNYFDAEEFKKQYFDNQKYVYPVFANNDLTKNYMEYKNGLIENVIRVR